MNPIASCDQFKPIRIGEKNSGELYELMVEIWCSFKTSTSIFAFEASLLGISFVLRTSNIRVATIKQLDFYRVIVDEGAALVNYHA